VTQAQVEEIIKQLHNVALSGRPDDLTWKINLALVLCTFLTFAATAFMAWKTAELSNITCR
jgi:hypothetical protein